MPRRHKPWWSERDRCYYTRIAGRQEALRDADGHKVDRGDVRGVAEAVARLLGALNEASRRGSDPTVEELCTAYAQAMFSEVSKETLGGKVWILALFCEFGTPCYGSRAARTIGPTELHAMRRAWERKGYSGGMLRRLYREVLACWAWAARPEPEREPIVILRENPLKGLKLPPGSPRHAKYASPEVGRALIAFAAARVAGKGPLRAHFAHQTVLMLRLLVESGCRPKEACEARWEDFDEDAALIVLPPDRHKTGRKTGRTRVIMMSRELAAELAALRDSGHAHPTHLFAHARSKGETSRGAGRETGAAWQRTGLSEWFKILVREARAAGLEIPQGMTLYWLRSSYITDAIQAGLSGDAAADLGGNTREIARQHYHHAQQEYLRQIHERVMKGRGEGG